MKFKVRGVRDPGDLAKERVVIEIMDDGNLGTLILASTKQQSPNRVSARIKNPYWVPDQEAKKGDLLVVYTKAGGRNSRENDDGSSSYFFYLGSEKALYEQPDQTVTVFSISSWRFAKREEVSST